MSHQASKLSQSVISKGPPGMVSGNDAVRSVGTFTCFMETVFPIPWQRRSAREFGAANCLPARDDEAVLTAWSVEPYRF